MTIPCGGEQHWRLAKSVGAISSHHEAIVSSRVDPTLGQAYQGPSHGMSPDNPTTHRRLTTPSSEATTQSKVVGPALHVATSNPTRTHVFPRALAAESICQIHKRSNCFIPLVGGRILGAYELMDCCYPKNSDKKTLKKWFFIDKRVG
ncbi:hypothetical protein L6164_017555 [Bauhinia variegata]|uniref:Uncharacterized protein n=1 Tax=Bauhinia variegata TaxID=167791 RepID=A0ACB9N8B2_BAUVA|nr:hypothetical protein L6164_017555 [Bauhinia variegata]